MQMRNKEGFGVNGFAQPNHKLSEKTEQWLEITDFLLF